MVTQMLNQSRFEQKFIVSPWDTESLKRGLRLSLSVDENARVGGSYLVTNLYLDTPDFQLYWLHKNVSHYRFKFRRRSYNGDSGGKFEVKEKIGDVTLKSVAYSQTEETQLILQRSCFFSGALVPKLYTRYRRYAFLCGDVRVTLDCDLEFSRFGVGIPHRPSFSILEIKSRDGRSAEVQSLLARYRLSQVSFSKYMAAVEEMALV